MSDLRVNFMGLELNNPLVASASPLSRDLDTARHLEDAGAAALVMYSLFEEQILAEERQYERFVANQSLGHGESDSFLPAQPHYQSSLEKYLQQVTALKQHLEIPVIASLNGVSEQGWVEYGSELVKAGADALELNLYGLAADVTESGADLERRYLDVLLKLKQAVSVPVAVKLSSQFSSPAHFAGQLQSGGASAVVLFNRFYQSDINLETLQVEPALQLSNSYESLLRVRWAAILRASLDIDLALTGGFHDSDDVVKGLLAGANVVQLCSVLLQHGPAQLSVILAGLQNWLDEKEYESLAQMRGSLSYSSAANPAEYERENYLSVLDSFTPPPGVRY
jgi:dihydroorotate dehydrogenase (fumarate)